MRIIAGEHRGRALVAPKDEKVTRPITDRVKEALFSRLQSLGMLSTDEAGDGPFVVLDVFSGTGSMGIECLSRGASQCTFIEQDREALTRLEENLTTFGLKPRSRVQRCSAFATMWTYGIQPGTLRLAFLDPPYAMMSDEKDLAQLTQLGGLILPLLQEGGVLVLRTPREADPLTLDGYDGPASFPYGGMTLHFYQSPLPEDDGDESEGDVPAAEPG